MHNLLKIKYYLWLTYSIPYERSINILERGRLKREKLLNKSIRNRIFKNNFINRGDRDILYKINQIVQNNQE
ncbi:hypothetical protein NEPAR08_0413 [Nematocida parisii]|nr:hypothetical protein NEPAR03_0424 [Nematocida parisii]KAI5126422.1 hypothetical protein NEPAR08_0413 [Nematocida parisii]